MGKATSILDGRTQPSRGTASGFSQIRRAGAFPFAASCLLLALWTAPERTLSQGTGGGLPSDYYSRSRGVLDRAVLEGILNKPEWSSEDAAKLGLLITNSSVSKLHEIDLGVRGFSERGGHQQDVAMLQALNADLRSGREKILSHLLSYFGKGMFETGRLRVLMGVFPDEKEMEAMLGLVPGLLARQEDDAVAFGLSLAQQAVQREIFFGEKRNAAYVAPIVSVLSRMAEEKPGETEKFCGSNFRSASCKTLLVAMGTEKGRQILEDAMARSVSSEADLTALSQSMPETMGYLVASPASANIQWIERIGDNVRHVGSRKLSESFFGNVRILLSSVRTKGDGKLAELLLAYLKAQSGNAKDPAWAQQAQWAISRLEGSD